MRLEVQTVDNSIHQIDNITELSFSRSADAACDSLWVYFKSESTLDEVVSIRLYNKDMLIFNGICDCQKAIEDKSGFKIYLYARSTASLLVDNQAEPYTYISPSAKQLSYIYALPYGIKCNLPDIYSDESYQVSGGTSCYGAINQFVYFCTGYNVAVSPDDTLFLLKPSKDIRSLNAYTVLSAQSTINRSEPISIINYKDSLGKKGYGYHMISETAKDSQITRARYVNLNSLPQWQRDYTVLQKLKKSFDDYKLLELTVSGWIEDELLQRYSYKSRIGVFDDYQLVEKRYICNGKGSVTRLVLRKTTDARENTYVD